MMASSNLPELKRITKPESSTKSTKIGLDQNLTSRSALLRTLYSEAAATAVGATDMEVAKEAVAVFWILMEP